MQRVMTGLAKVEIVSSLIPCDMFYISKRAEYEMQTTLKNESKRVVTLVIADL